MSFEGLVWNANGALNHETTVSGTKMLRLNKVKVDE